MDEEEVSKIPWQEVIAALVRRWKLILIVFLLGAVASAVFAFFQAPTYIATAKIMVSSERARIAVSPDPKAGTMMERMTEQDLNSEVSLLKSMQLVRDVLEPYHDRMQQPAPQTFGDRLTDLVRISSDLLNFLYQKIHGVPDVTPFEHFVRSTAAYVNVNPVKGSNLIEVTYEDESPEWSAEFVNHLVQRHVERHAEMYQQAEAQRFIESQRELLSGKLHDAELARQRFYEREGIDAVPEQRDGLRARIGELETALSQANTELAEGQARSEYLAKEIQTLPKGLAPDAGAGPLTPGQMVRGKILELQLQRSQLLSQYSPTSIRVTDIDRQIAEAQRLLVEEEKVTGTVTNPAQIALSTDLSQTRVQLAALRARIDALGKQIADTRAKLDHLDRVASEQDQLEQEVASAREAFLTYRKKEEEARFSTALDESHIVNVSIIELARPPSSPRPNKAPMKFMLGAAFSLFAGAALAYIRDRFDPTVKSAADAKKVTGLGILADIPS